MPDVIKLTNSIDTWVSLVHRGQFGDSNLYVNSESRAYVFYALPPMMPGSSIVSAKLRLIPNGSSVVSSTIVLKRCTSKWDVNSVVWVNDEPSVTAVDQVSIGPRAFGPTVWEFDVTAHVQNVMGGTGWFGWQLSSSTVGSDNKFYGGQSNIPMELEISYTTPPRVPTELYPRNNAIIGTSRPNLTWNAVGATAGSKLLAYEVQVDDDALFAVNAHTNIITNGAFETNNTGWTTIASTQTRVTSQFHSGVASNQVVTSSGPSQGVFWAPAGSQGAGVYSGAVWVKGTGSFRVQLASIPAASAFVQKDVTLSGEWQRIPISGTAPGGTTQVYMIVFSMNAGVTTFFMDDAILVSGATLPDAWAWYAVSDTQSLDLTTTDFVALSTGSSRWWRVRVKNDSGLWSPWSETVQFTYVDPTVLTVTSPGASTGDPTPTITWTFAGSQVAHEVLLSTPNVIGGGYSVVYDSGVIYSSALTHDIPIGVIKKVGGSFRVEVRSWDSAIKVTMPGAPSYAMDTQDFTWTPAGAAAPVDMTVAQVMPHVLVRWQYSGSLTNLSHFNIFRTINGVTTFWSVSASQADADEPVGGWYRWIDALVPGRRTITYEVQTVISGGVGNTSSPSASNPTRTIKIDNQMPWVVSIQDNVTNGGSNIRRFCMVNADIDPGLSEVSDLVTPVQGPAYLVQQSFQGFIGSAQGEITWDAIPAGAPTAEAMKDNFLWMRLNPRVYFLWLDQAIECYIYNCAFTPIGRADGKTDYVVSFDFVQVPRSGLTNPNDPTRASGIDSESWG